MPTICAFYGILIKMYWNDHAPPHFHVDYAELLEDWKLCESKQHPKKILPLV